MSTRIKSGWLIGDATKLPFKLEGKYIFLTVHRIWPRIEIKGKPSNWDPSIKQIVCLLDIEIENRSRDHELSIGRDLTVKSSKGFSLGLLNGLDDKTPEKYVYFNENAFGSEWIPPMQKKRAKIAFRPAKDGEFISTLHLIEIRGDEYELEINFDPSLSAQDQVSGTKTKSNYSDEAFYIEKINKIENEIERGNAFRLFLTGKKTNKDSDKIIQEIIAYLSQNNQLTDDIHNYFKKIKSDQLIDEVRYERESIPTRIKDQVWRRDQGRCVECGSNEKLEFDHIIPISKGGANSYRNIQLLCEPCNRRKSAKIV